MAVAEINVLDVLPGVGTGDGDIDTQAFSNALNYASRAPGTVVRVPPLDEGQFYRIHKPLSVQHCALVGSAVCTISGAQAAPEIHFNYRANILVNEAGSVHGLILVNDDLGINEDDPDRALLHKTACIEVSDTCHISNLLLMGWWEGIVFSSEGRTGLTCIDQVNIQRVWNCGIRVNGCRDVAWISRVKVFGDTIPWFKNEGTGFDIVKADTLKITDCHVQRADVAFRLRDAWATLTGCTSDSGRWGIVASGTTVSINGGSFWCNYSGLWVREGELRLMASGAEFAGDSEPAVLIHGGHLVTLSGCYLRRTHHSYREPALVVSGGDCSVVAGCVLDVHLGSRNFKEINGTVKYGTNAEIVTR